ncbi:MAG: hypothetical protein ACK5M4_01840 [Pseudorhodobacter sp.]
MRLRRINQVQGRLITACIRHVSAPPCHDTDRGEW